MRGFPFVVLILAPFARSDPKCPENVVCTSTLTRKSCPAKTFYREKVASMNCCPGCVLLKGLGVVCREDRECAPGLYCPKNENDGYGISARRCTLDEEQSCEYYKRTNRVWIETHYWEPDCLPDGKYGEKQCKGEKLEGKCFCSNENGVRIFGESSWADAANMTCACSRLAEKLRRTRKDTSLHCDEKGNFEPLQCDNGICWCANHLTGIPYTPVVPEMMTRILPCFEEESFGSQYLRKCESIHVQTERAVKILKNHGLETVVLPVTNCNFDGSYARIQVKGGMKYCAKKNNKRLTDPSPATVNCNCEYDKFVAGEMGREFHLECDGKGGYKPEQALGNFKFKVDSDGCPFYFETRFINDNGGF